MSGTASLIKNILIEKFKLDEMAWEEAVFKGEESGESIEDILVADNVVSQDAITLATAESVNMSPVRLSRFAPDVDLVESLPADTLLRHKILPLAKCGKSLTVAMGDPFDIVAVDELTGLTGLKIVSVVASEKEIRALLEQHVTRDGGQLEEILQDVEDQEVELGIEGGEDLDLDQMLELAEDAPVVRVVNSILVEGMRKGCSDIHIEPMEKAIRLRYRIDGILYESPAPPRSMLAAISSRIKIMANLDIAERRIPQDGRIKIRALDKEVDIRVSLLPTVHGEKCVMRILDKTQLPPGIDALGLDELAYKRFTHALKQPYGMIFVTGPTGSGKTTTLYSSLTELNKPGVNIITAEDPVEYQLKGINQVQTNASVGLSFASSLRAMLRQDPDIVMVGEVRDLETASICVQAALTGHLVLSTLHTNDAVGAIARLKNMGIENFMISSSLILAQAQRLHRTLCPACKEPIDPPLDLLKKNEIDPDSLDISKATFFTAKGCPKCHDIGYRGRGAIMEILAVDDELRTMINKDARSEDILNVAVDNGLVTLRQAGLNRAMSGVTSVEEILRITSSH